MGKFTGSWTGLTLGGAEAKGRDNLGLGLVSQPGVAIDLTLSSTGRFATCAEEEALE
jgi:hypothetical protein